MLSNHIFDFERPIVELENRLEEMRAAGQEEGANELEKTIESLKKNIYKNLTRWQRVQISRHPERPYAMDYLESITEQFIELFGDRNYRDDKAMIGGIGQIQGQTVMFIGQQKGRTTKQRQYRNFGMPNPEGYRKALRLMKMAEKFQIPVVTLIDTPGAYPGLEAEERGQGEAIARNLYEMATLKTPIVCIIIGEGASGGALGIAVGDRVFQLENTWYSVISPESCSSILWRSWEHKERAAEALKLTAMDNLELGIIDGILPEPMGGAHKKPTQIFEEVKNTILTEIAALKEYGHEELIERRINKFTKIGRFQQIESIQTVFPDLPQETVAVPVPTPDK